MLTGFENTHGKVSVERNRRQNVHSVDSRVPQHILDMEVPISNAIAVRNGPQAHRISFHEHHSAHRRVAEVNRHELFTETESDHSNRQTLRRHWDSTCSSSPIMIARVRCAAFKHRTLRRVGTSEMARPRDRSRIDSVPSVPSSFVRSECGPLGSTFGRQPGPRSSGRGSSLGTYLALHSLSADRQLDSGISRPMLHHHGFGGKPLHAGRPEESVHPRHIRNHLGGLFGTEDGTTLTP